MAEDEDETVRRLGAYRTEITNLVGDHRGRVVDFTGDNFLAEFPTATDAVEAATEIQRVLKARNAAVPSGRAMEFRIGVHLGEVRVEGERIYGDGVNIAARLEGLADPGGTCISGTVLEQIRRKLEIDFDDLGEQEVKNIPDPVHAYRLRERASDIPAQRQRGTPRAIVLYVAAAFAVVAIAVAVYFTMTERSPAPAGAPLTSIAVLPFDDMSPGGDQEWLANGMAEELIESLSRIEALRVIARTSAFALRGKDIQTVGATLKVGSVVEGSVRRSGDDLRITAQLIRVEDGFHLWSARYDRELDDVFEIQQEIAREIAEAIRSEFGIAMERIETGQARYMTADLRAYELLRRGTERFDTLTDDGFQEAEELYLRALDIDPSYAAAHTSLGWAHIFRWLYGYDRSWERLAWAKAAATRALEIAAYPGAQALFAMAAMFGGELEAAERLLQQAVETNPGSGLVRAAYGNLLLERGEIEAALVQHRRAVALDPLVPYRYIDLANALLFSGHYDAAIERLEYALSLNPRLQYVRATIAFAHHQKGMDREALDHALRDTSEPELRTALRDGFSERGYQGMNEALMQAVAAVLGTPCTPEPAIGAHLYANAGDAEEMYRCLDRALTERGLVFLHLRAHPVWDPYRDDPRFAALLRRMGLEE
jgi:adenylate cyclase